MDLVDSMVEEMAQGVITRMEAEEVSVESLSLLVKDRLIP